jgi:3-oxoacyl-[acyl-carrier-protein] synthase I
LSGFQSFQAVSDELCKPFDENRKGINLGEGAAAVILTADEKLSKGIKIAGGAISNDANHISGPSRTGEELCEAINRAMADAGLSAEDIDMVSAHGTATVFNDEMESKAFTLARVNNAPVNSLKGFYGHTLGAAGIIESVISIHSLKNDLLIPTLGFTKHGVSNPLNICSTLTKTPLHHCLKTASGFGGCNAAVILTKHLN